MGYTPLEGFGSISEVLKSSDGGNAAPWWWGRRRPATGSAWPHARPRV